MEIERYIFTSVNPEDPNPFKVKIKIRCITDDPKLGRYIQNQMLWYAKAFGCEDAVIFDDDNEYWTVLIFAYPEPNQMAYTVPQAISNKVEELPSKYQKLMEHIRKGVG
jgi:hypothetical protein